MAPKLKPKWVTDYLVYNRKERIAIICFIVAIAGLILVSVNFFQTAKPLALKQDSVLLLAIDTLQQKEIAKKKFQKQGNYYTDENNSGYRYDPSQSKGFTNGELFQFDPNSISLNDWQRLGLNEKTSKTILKYLSKGGKFYKPEDLLKIWGMPEGFYERVKDHIVITSFAKAYPKSNFNKPEFEKDERKPSAVNINSGDTSAFIALPGIGSKLSARIVAFREKLGGFYSVDQIGETYGLPDSTFQKIKPRLQVDENALRKINVNVATKDELKTHPYIRWNLANAIVEYRNQHGEFKTLDDLKNIVLIDEVTFEKIRHYLTF